MKYLLFALLVLSQCSGWLFPAPAYAQSATTGGSTQSESEGKAGKKGEQDDEDGAEGDHEDAGRYVKGTRIEVFVKNDSSLKKTLTIYDDVCRRYAVPAKRFRAYQKLRVKLCINEDDFAEVTVSRITGSRKRHYRQVEARDVVKFR